MADACVGQLGEVEQKLVNLVEEIFASQQSKQIDDEGTECITKEQCREFVFRVMTEAGEDDAWDEREFDECYQEFDYDGNGTISREELLQFIKRFA